MPYCPNGSLQDLLNSRFLTVREIIRYTDQILTGVHYIHANGYVHLDIKPSNILIHEDGSAVLSDFGQSMSLNWLGIADAPPMYYTLLPPEIFIINKVTPFSDMYQIGVTLYRLCNGDDILKEQIPYSDSDLQRQIVAGRFPNRNMFLPHIPRRLKTIIRRLLNTDQQKRYDSIIDLQNDLGQVNTLLDWQYSKTEGTLRWQKRTLYHTYTIEIVQRKPHNWFIDGYTTSSTTGRKRRRNLWCAGPFTTEKKTINDVSRIFREMEAR